MQKIKKIHFINRLDYNNVGDWNCSPLLYYYDYFKHFNIIRHDIDFINYNEIEKEDVVIIGGGGLFDVTESFNQAISRVLDMCDNVVGWSCGFNTHNGRWFQGDSFSPIDFSKFKLVGTRDYNHPSGIEYLPCPSSLAFDIFQNEDYHIKRKFGFIGHKDIIGDNYTFEDSISNNENINRVAEYILSSEAIVTNSYHCAYWTMLLGKKAIVLNKFSTKFDFYKYEPEFVEIEKKESKESIEKKLQRAFENAKNYDGLFDEAKELNDTFFEKVKCVIEQAELEKNVDYQNLYLVNCQQSWNRLAVTKELLELKDARDRLSEDNSELKKEIANLEQSINNLEKNLQLVYRRTLIGRLSYIWHKFDSWKNKNNIKN